MSSPTLRKAFGIGASAMLSASVLLTVFAGSAFAAGSISTAGNASVSQDTCITGNAPTGNIAITVTAVNDIVAGPITFTAPAGFNFDTSAANPTVVTNTTGSVVTFATRTATTVTYNVAVIISVPGTLTVNLGRILVVNPDCGPPPNPQAGTAGNVTITTSTIAGVPAGTPAGTYTITAGVNDHFVVTLPAPGSNTQAVGGSFTPRAQLVDFWGNAKSVAGVPVTWTSNPSLPGCTGTFSTNPVLTNGSGIANVTFGPVGGGGCTYTFTASSPGLLPGTSPTATVTGSAIAATCTGATNLDVGETFICTFSVVPLDPSVTFVAWSQSGPGTVIIDPAFPLDTFASNPVHFQAATVGADTITATYTDNVAPLTHTINIPKNIRASTVDCVPADGSTIMLLSIVNCTFSAGVHSLTFWTNNGNFTIGANNANSASFTATGTGTGTITVTYNNLVGPQTQVFTYHIVNNISGGSCGWSPTLTEARGGGFAGPTTLTCTEGAINDFGNGFSFRIHKAPAAPGAGAVRFDISKVISIIAPNSLGLTAAYVNDTTIQITSTPPSGHTDQNQIEAFTLGNIFDEADAGTTLGAINTTVTNTTGAIGNTYFIGGATANVTGTMTAPITALQNNFNVTVTSTCAFAVTAGGNSVLTFTATGDTVAILAVSAVSGGVQNITIAGHANPESGAVTQTVLNCNTFPSIGNVVDALILTSDGTPIVDQGETNQIAGALHLAEQAPAFVAAGTVCTGTEAVAGVLNSNAPTISVSHALGMTVSSATLSGDRKSWSFTVTAASVVPVGPAVLGATINITNINYDVDASAVAGSLVNVTVVCVTALVAPTSVANAIVGNSVNFTATSTIVFIGYNDQKSGIITGTEGVAGSFGAAGSLTKLGAAAFNQITFCLGGGASFTRAPWLVITAGGPATTPSSDGLQLLNTTTHLGTNQQQGVLSVGNTCATFTFYSGSTTTPGSFVLVGGDTAPDKTVGPGYNIAPGSLVGPVNVTISGLSVAGTTEVGIVVTAFKQFKSDVCVRATTEANVVASATCDQPAPATAFIAPGTIDGAANNVTVYATDPNDQFQTGETITCTILNSAFNINQQTFLEVANQNETPVIQYSGTGMVAHLVLLPPGSNSFQLIIDQEATGGVLGAITVTNIHYTVVTGSTLGPVIVECTKSSGPGSAFDQFTTNASIGTPPPAPTPPSPSALRALGSLGKNTTGPYNNNQTFLVFLKNHTNNVVTIDFSASSDGAPLSSFNGMKIQVCFASKANPEHGAFGGFTNCTTRVLGTSAGQAANEAWYFASATAPRWISVRARLIGNATFASSPWTQTVQIHWTGH